MNKIAAGVLPVVALYLIQHWSAVTIETMQLWVAAATLPVAIGFIIAFVPERPWRHWFGTSLLLIAVAVLAWCLTIVLFRVSGPVYWGREFMVVASSGLTFTAMVMRLCVLLSAQRHDRSIP